MKKNEGTVWVGEWMDGWMDVEAGLRIAYNNKKLSLWLQGPASSVKEIRFNEPSYVQCALFSFRLPISKFYK